MSRVKNISLIYTETRHPLWRSTFEELGTWHKLGGTGACFGRCSAACTCGTKPRRGLKRRCPVIDICVRSRLWSNSLAMNCSHLVGRAPHFRSLPPTQHGRAAPREPPRGSATQRKSAFFRNHKNPYDCLPLPNLPTPRPPELSLHLDSRKTYARTLLPAALAPVPFGFVLVRIRVRVLPRGLERQVRAPRGAFRPRARRDLRCSPKSPLGELFSPEYLVDHTRRQKLGQR
jgi:hypothetical protein